MSLINEDNEEEEEEEGHVDDDDDDDASRCWKVMRSVKIASFTLSRRSMFRRPCMNLRTSTTSSSSSFSITAAAKSTVSSNVVVDDDGERDGTWLSSVDPDL